MFRVLCPILIAVPLLSHAQAPANNEKVPVIDGGAGPCSLELTVTGADGKPVYAATVKVHIKYGFGGMRRLDLEAGTNSDGKVKFAGLPAKVQRPPLEFHASKDEFEGVASFDPSTECQAKHDVTLEKSKGKVAAQKLADGIPKDDSRSDALRIIDSVEVAHRLGSSGELGSRAIARLLTM